MNMSNQELLRALPSVDEVLKTARREESGRLSAALFTWAVRKVLGEARLKIVSGEWLPPSIEDIIVMAMESYAVESKPSLCKVVNATGTVLHTNIGRAVLCVEAQEAVFSASRGNVNIELDISTGARSDRDCRVERLITRLTSAEAATVVNNNAAAVVLAINTLAQGREVIVSRGELVEIGASFRLAEIVGKSGAILREVGSTNKTRIADFEAAISGNTALLFKAHTSNYKVVGFTCSATLKELHELGKAKGLPIVYDLGSGSLIDLSAFGLPNEPQAASCIASGADVITFSGDKLLGGPQAGIIAGKKEIIDRIRNNPLKRALRVDKLTMAALEATLRLYLEPERLKERLPVLRYMTRPIDELDAVAQKAATSIRERLGPGYIVAVDDDLSTIGGGALPTETLRTRVVAITHERHRPHDIYRRFLDSRPPILGRVGKGRFLLDPRCVDSYEELVPSFDVDNKQIAEKGKYPT
ncbi:MAG: L-seryl-tRNA(Sec) selenium transferase [Deltaproteobacteria bacterium]|nr:L-seryl-tRNA(Sec) selenium transferase [Deltaproteobacteria bacterium]